MSRVRRWSRPAAVVLVLVLAGAGAAAAEDRYRGRTLGEVLRELRAAGLELVYSSAVVAEGAIVTAEPDAAEPRAVLDAVLRAAGLHAEDGPGRVVLILAGADPASPSGGAAAGVVRPIGFREEVNVVPGRRRVEDERGSPASVIERGDALLVPAIGGDLGRIVERLPGVVTSDNSAAWNVRGSLAGDTSLVVDGLELYDPYHLRAFQSPFTLVDPRVVRSIAVLPGGFTVERGDRHGAFVEITTLDRFERSTGEVELGTLNSRFAVAAPARGGAASWLVAGRAWYPESIVDSIGLGGGERLRPRLGDLYVKLGGAVSPRTLLSVHGLLSYDRVSFRESEADDAEQVEVLSRQANVWLRAVTVWSPRWRGETVVSAGRIESDRDGVAAPEEDTFVVRDARDLTYAALSHDATWAPRPRGRVKLGARVRWLDAGYDYELRREGDPDPERAAVLEPTGVAIALYAAYRHVLAPGLAGEIGARWDRQHATGDDGALAPRAHLVWTPSPRTEVRLAAGRFAQSQRLHELAIEDGETEFSRAELSDQIEVSATHRLPSELSVRLDVYTRDLSRLRTRYENLFSLVELFPEASDDRVAISPDGARLSGLELTVAGPDDRALRWWAAYALASAEDRVDGRDVPRTFDQRHSLSFLTAWRGAARRWEVALAGSAHTGRPVTPVAAGEVTLPDGSTGYEPVAGPRNAARLPDYLRFDLKVARRVATRRGAVTVTLDVLNLTDRDNACCVADAFVEPAGDGTVGVRTEYESWLGIVPTMSVRWEF